MPDPYEESSAHHGGSRRDGSERVKLSAASGGFPHSLANTTLVISARFDRSGN
jgi:hypothetical protein